MALVLANLVNVFATPTDVFLNVREKPKWLVPFLFIALVTIGIALFTVPLTKQITFETLSKTMKGAQLKQAFTLSEQFALIGVVFSPVLLLFRWLMLSATLYFASILFHASEIRFKTVYAVVVFSELILLLMGIINILLLYIRGTYAIHHITDLQAIVGLDYFLPDKTAHPPLFTFLNNFNIFSVWYVVTLSIGVSVIANFSKLRSAIIVGTVWLFGVGLQVSFATISLRISTP